MIMANENPEKENIPDDNLNRYTFEINCEGMIRTTTITAESKSEAERIVKEKNPHCNIRFLWRHD